MKAPSDPVRLVEVGPRDGLQNIKEHVPTAVKLELIRRLSRTGLRTIELTSVVSPRAVPQLADCRAVLGNEVIKRLQESAGNRLPVLVPNLKGLDVAIDRGVREVAVFVSATDGFSRANINCSVEDGIERARAVAAKAIAHGMDVRGYVSCIFSDPFDGPTTPSAVLRCAKELIDMGCYEVSLGDTLGTGTPGKVRSLVTYLVENDVPVGKLAGHFHDTYGQGVANAWEAYNCGLRVFDSSVGGLGGCPFAPGAEGNVATEDLVHMFHNNGIPTGVDLPHLIKTGIWISRALSMTYATRAGKALAHKYGLLPPSHPVQPIIHPSTSWSPIQDTGKFSGRLLAYRSGGNLKVVLNRPKKGNALTPKMISDLAALIEKCNNEPSISRIIVAAKGKFFCMGVDEGGGSADVGIARLTRLFDVIEHSPKTTIACVNGPAFGTGVGLALSCDIRISIRTATFALGEAKFELGGAVNRRLELFTQKSTLSAHPVTASKLKLLGIVAETAETTEELQESLDKLLMQLRTSPWTASQMSTGLVQFTWTHAGDERQRIRQWEQKLALQNEGIAADLQGDAVELRDRNHWMCVVRA